MWIARARALHERVLALRIEVYDHYAQIHERLNF